MTLRPLTVWDAGVLQPMLDDPAVRAAMRWDIDQNRDAARWLTSVIQQQEHPHYRFVYTFGVVLDDTDVLAGVVMVTIAREDEHAVPPVLQAELSIFLAPEHRGHGHAGRALRRVREWCFDDLAVLDPFGGSAPMGEVIAACLPTNDASRSMLGRLLVPRGTVEAASRRGGGTVTALKFGLTRAERREHPGR
ncbi:GNAT family N-acetyltransferase [Kitasatospora sp. NPDC058965]|uniref:GNAT family N-acetyltransferase n=1 Tax=Kitasatospora sp. NPDC058965 TaxID=3346682 RepID=UPI00369565B9